MFKAKLLTTFALCTFLVERIRFSLSSESTIKVLPAKQSFPSEATKSFVFGVASVQPSTKVTLPSHTRSESAERSAPWRIFLGMLYDQSRGCGPCTLPPPFQSGERSDAIRARPVPFCFQSLRPAPETSPRVFVAEVPCRALAMKFRTAAWIRPSFSGAPNTTSDSSSSPTSSFLILRTFTVGITLLLGLWFLAFGLGFLNKDLRT